GAQDEEHAARARDDRPLPAAPGRVALAERAPVRVRLPAGRARLSRALLPARVAADAAAGEARLARAARARGRPPGRPPPPPVIPALIVIAYLGVFAFRRAHGRKEVEDYFLANRSLGPFVFLMSLFGTNMTAFSILGSSGHAFNNGIVTYGLMASSSGLVIPL